MTENTLGGDRVSMIVLWALSTSLALALAAPGRAHEVQPAIADLTIDGRDLTLSVEAALEPFVAGIDLDGLSDTNASARTGANDELRRLPPEALAERFRADWPQMRQGITIRSGEVAVTPELGPVSVPPVGDPALPRMSTFTLKATLPAGDAPVEIGWAPRFGALVIRQQPPGGAAQDDASLYDGYLTSGQISDPIPRTGGSPKSWPAAFADYVSIGFEHIVPKGLDHILFVLGLFFLSQRLGPLLWQVSAFTLAHTVSLALGILGYVSVPSQIVEPLIAASIAYVGVENVLSRGLSPWRPVVVFLFGLLHGLGFASVLGEIGLDPARFVTGLIGFNLGVELGQLAVIAGAFLAVGIWSRGRPWYRRAIANPASIAIALTGAYWTVERTLL